MSQEAHMVEQVIKYSDGTETVIKYRGVIVDGVLQSEKIEEVAEESASESSVAEAAEVPVEETPASEEVQN